MLLSSIEQAIADGTPWTGGTSTTAHARDPAGITQDPAATTGESTATTGEGLDTGAAAIFGTRFGITPEERDERVRGRLRRQQILSREVPPALWVILDHAVLTRPAGGHRVMAEQVGALVEAARSPSIRIQVIPAETGAHEGVVGSFAIADFADAAAALAAGAASAYWSRWPPREAG